MNNKKIIAVGAVLTAVIAIIGLSAATYASQGNFFHSKGFMNNKNHDAIQEAMNNNDYSAWRELMGNRMSQISADNFSQFIQAQKLIQSGDREGARAIFSDLGIEKQARGPRDMMGGEDHQAMLDAINNNDYQAFKAINDYPMADQVTEDNWSQFVEAHKLMQSGDREGAEAIFEEIGIKMPGRGPRGMGGGMHRAMYDTNGDGICDHLDDQDSN